MDSKNSTPEPEEPDVAAVDGKNGLNIVSTILLDLLPTAIAGPFLWLVDLFLIRTFPGLKSTYPMLSYELLAAKIVVFWILYRLSFNRPVVSLWAIPYVFAAPMFYYVAAVVSIIVMW